MIIICIRSAADRTGSRVFKVHVPLFSHRGIHAKPEYPVGHVESQRRGERILRIEDQGGHGTALDSGADLRQCILDTAVAVDLVAEQVRDHYHFWTDQRDDLLQGCLVAFQDGVFISGSAEPVGIAEQIGGNSVEEVGTGPVAQAAVAGCCDHMLDHVAGGRLSVCTGHYHDLHVLSRHRENIL